MVQVCQGAKTMNDMVVQALEQYKEMFIIARREFNRISGVRSNPDFPYYMADLNMF